MFKIIPINLFCMIFIMYFCNIFCEETRIKNENKDRFKKFRRLLNEI